MRAIAMLMRLFFACAILLAAPVADASCPRGVDGVKSSRKADCRCVDAELKLYALIEKFEDSELRASEALISASANAQLADGLCAKGDTQSAMIFYQSTYNQLVEDLRQLGIRLHDIE
jgi:hypothetical protein